MRSIAVRERKTRRGREGPGTGTAGTAADVPSLAPVFTDGAAVSYPVLMGPNRRTIIGASIVLLVSYGCSSDDGHADPVARCEEFIDAYCEKATSCAVAADPSIDRSAFVANCVTGAKQTLACAKAVSVGASYSQCLEDVRTMTCTPFEVFAQTGTSPLPANCKGVIGIRD